MKVLAICAGVVLALASTEGAMENWPEPWEKALRARFPHRWHALAATTGDGLRKLLASDEDLQEATYHCANSLLSRRQRTAEQLRATGQRLLTFAVAPLEAIGRSTQA